MKNPKRQNQELESIKQPHNVKVLILSNNKTTIKEFYLIKNYINLIKIDLSYNKLSAFPTGFTFKPYSKLRTLLLHYNKFTTLKHLTPVSESQTINYLTLFGNPLEEVKVRHFFVNEMASLKLMDDKIVRVQERSYDISIKQKPSDAPILSFPIIKLQAQQNNRVYLQNVIRQLSIIRNLYLNTNSIIKIQRWWKHHQKLKYRRWNIVSLQYPPLHSEQSLMINNIKQSKVNLNRLITEKMTITKTAEEKMFSLMIMNYQFWKELVMLIKMGKVYFSRDYCLQKSIQFDEVTQFTAIRHLEQQNTSKYQQKISFFLQYHKRLVLKKASIVRPVIDLSSKTIEKYSINRAKFIKRQQTQVKRQQQYRRYYVLPLLSFDLIFQLIKLEYYSYVRSYLNKVEHVTFPVICQYFFKKSFAATTIQRCWKGYKTRKIVNVDKHIKQKKAVIKIQKWIRKLKFIHRHKFLLQVSHYLKNERNSKDIILQMSQIQAIESYCTYKQEFGKNLIIPFQQCLFELTAKSSMISLSSYSKVQVIFYSERNPYPEYMNLSFKNNDISKPKFTKGCKSNILEILFKSAKHIQKLSDKGTNYVKISYHSIEQTLNRKFILALKTYRMINHQFIQSINQACIQNKFTSSIIDDINENKIISIVSDSQKDVKEGTVEHQFRLLQSKTSKKSFNSDMAVIDSTICIKIRYFLLKVDLSCHFFLKPLNYSLKSKQQLKDSPVQYYLGRRLSKRYDEQTETISKISRNIMSLDEMQPHPHPASERKDANYQKILNTDQSHTIIQSLSPQNSERNFSSRRIESHDKFDKQVYPPATEVLLQNIRYKIRLGQIEELRCKKQRIQNIKINHRQKLNLAESQKMESLNKLKTSKVKDLEIVNKMIVNDRYEQQQENIRKHNYIREQLRNKTTTFQKQFLKKGIKSIKKEFRQYQKSRSFRESHHNIEPSKTQKQKLTVYKTEIKEFSLSIAEDQHSTEFVRGSAKEKLKKQIQTYNFSKEGEMIRQSNYSEQKLEQITQQKKARQIQRKKLKKKRLVHSVFPQQFYPLMQSNQIGFSLPKIDKK